MCKCAQCMCECWRWWWNQRKRQHCRLPLTTRLHAIKRCRNGRVTNRLIQIDCSQKQRERERERVCLLLFPVPLYHADAQQAADRCKLSQRLQPTDRVTAAAAAVQQSNANRVGESKEYRINRVREAKLDKCYKEGTSAWRNAAGGTPSWPPKRQRQQAQGV